MLSLGNAFTKEDLLNFEKKILNYLNKKKDFEIEYSAEPKIDGISASLIYIDGKFKTGLSRGDGTFGEDFLINSKCPSCRQPIVGTSPILFFFRSINKEYIK